MDRNSHLDAQNTTYLEYKYAITPLAQTNPDTTIPLSQQLPTTNKINLGSLTINSFTTLTQNPNAPLIEARSKFTNISEYYGSDYLFIKLGLTKEQFFKQFEQEQNKIYSNLNQTTNQSTPLQPARMLGDSFTESKLLKEQLAAIRKDAMYLDDEDDDETSPNSEVTSASSSQIKSLLDNTASEFSRLNLKLAEIATKGLTQSQINSLEKDIISFESVNLGGMNILVPKIYLSLKTRNTLAEKALSLEGRGLGEGDDDSFATSSTIFAKNDLTLNSPTATLLNSGSIISGKNMVLSLASLRNQSSSALTSYVGQAAEIKSGGNLKITASGDFTNNSSIISRKDMMLNLASLKNQSSSALTSYVGQAAEIKSGGNLEITALGDIENYRSTIQSAQNLILTSRSGDIKNLGAKILTTNDLRLTTLRGNIINSSLVQTNDAALLNSNPDAYRLSPNASPRTSGNITSALLATSEIKGGSIEISAGNNFTNLAAKITSSEDLKIEAGNDINITTLQLRNRTEERGGSKKTSWEKITDSTTNLASEISSTGNISLNSNSDVNIIGSNLTAADNITITSTQNTNILAAQNTSFTSESSSKKGFSVSKSSGSGNSSLTNILANLNTENGDIIIASKGDTNIIGAKLNGGSDASITSLGETNISSVTDQNSSYSYANKSKTGILQALPVANPILKYIAATDLLGLTRITDNLTGGGYSNLAGNEKTRVNTSGSNQEIQTTNLTTNNNLQIQSNQDLNLTSTNLKSENGDIELASNQNINILAAQAISTSSRDEDGKTDHKKSSTEITKTEGRSTSSTLEANNITLTSANDITLQATKITARDHSPLEGESESVSDPVGGQVNITAANNLLITTAQDFSTSSETNKSKTTFAKSLGNSGAINTQITNTEIFITDPIKLKLDAGNVIYAEYDPSKSTSSNLNYLAALDPTKAIYNPLTETHIAYDQTNRSLTNTGTAIITIAAVTAVVLTAGALTAPAAAGAGATTAVATTTTTATIGTTMATAAASTAAATFSVSATNASMNADGSAINQLKTTTKTAVKDTTSKESLQQIAIAATTAALAAGASQATGMTNATNATNAVPSTFERVTTNFATGLQKAGIYSTSNILATSVIKGQGINQTIEQQGGGEKILLNTAMNALAETGAKEIGLAAHTDQINKSTQLILHAGLGATIAAARGSDNTAGILAGAAAAVVGEAAGDAARNNDIDKGAGVAIAQGAGALASLTTSVAMGEGDDDTAKNVGIGASIGANAAANNAYFGERPLQIKLRNGEKIFIPTVTGKILDQRNVELAHEQLFFEDKQGGNLGYFEDNKVKPEDPKLLSLFKPTLTGFDDSLMREAVRNVQPKPYSLLGVESCKYNCQDWSAAVRSEYYHLETQKNLEIWNQLTRPQVNLNQVKQ